MRDEAPQSSAEGQLLDMGGGPLGRCLVMNLRPRSALLFVAEPRELPSRIIVGTGGLWREAEVLRRQGKFVNVGFGEQ
jgi:hypothetical protein